MTLHTPGPWRVGTPAPDRVDYFAHTVRDADGWGLAEVTKWNHPDVAKANATLMAAAPEMLATINDLVDSLKQALLLLPDIRPADITALARARAILATINGGANHA